MDIIFLQLEVGLIEIASIHLEVLMVIHVLYDCLGVVSSYHSPFLACFAKNRVFLINGINKDLVLQFGVESLGSEKVIIFSDPLFLP